MEVEAFVYRYLVLSCIRGSFNFFILAVALHALRSLRSDSDGMIIVHKMRLATIQTACPLWPSSPLSLSYAHSLSVQNSPFLCQLNGSPSP
jgi:hypothetical protein